MTLSFAFALALVILATVKAPSYTKEVPQTTIPMVVETEEPETEEATAETEETEEEPTAEGEVVFVETDQTPTLTSFSVPAGHNTKTYASYSLFHRQSKQYALQQIATTDERGFRRVGDAYCVALGTYYGTTIGDKYIVTLDNGYSFEVVLCDVKSDQHTDSNHQYTTSNGCMVEFYVEIGRLVQEVKIRGSVSVLPEFDGCVTSIQKIEGENVLWYFS